MTTPPPLDPVAPADTDARALAARLMRLDAAALSYLEADTATPGISRIAFGQSTDGCPMTFISRLAPHFDGLARHPDCALLLGEAGAKGDPLTHPRLMLKARAEFIGPDDPQRPGLRDKWLADHPKSKLYIDFADFAFVLLHPVSALLNAGFARAYRLTADDLRG